MNDTNIELLKYREHMYRLLSSIYINEVDGEMLAALKKIDFPVEEDAIGWQRNLNEGYRLIKDYLSVFAGKSEAETAALLEDLAADYAKTFLAAGDATGKAAFPYESVYTGTDSQFGGSVQMRLAAEYAAKGFEIKQTGFRIMEDHIGLEFGFIAELLKTGKEADAAAFFFEHPVKWANLFANDIYKYSERDFYKGIARITLGFTEAEKEYLAGEQ